MSRASSGWSATPSTIERRPESQGTSYRPDAGPPAARARIVIPTVAIAESHLLSLGCLLLPVKAEAHRYLGLVGPEGLAFPATLGLDSAGYSRVSVPSAS